VRVLKPNTPSGYVNNGFDLGNQVRDFFKSFSFVLVIRNKQRFNCHCFDVAQQTYDLKFDWNGRPNFLCFA
jgi:hypothetical protein